MGPLDTSVYSQHYPGVHPTAAEWILSPGATRLWRTRWRLAGGFTPRRLTFFHQVDDPHSHFLLGVLAALRARFDLIIDLRVVPEPAGIYDPDPVRARQFALRDARELTRFFEIDLPEPGPRSPADVTAVQARLLGLKNTDDAILEALKLSERLWRGQAISHPGGDVGPGLQRAQSQLHRSGYYRGASLFYEGEHYPGVSRLELLIERLALDTGGSDAPVITRRKAPHPPVKRLPQRARLEWFYSFRSPYSYLSVDLIAKLSSKYNLDVVIRPVLPMVMRGLPVPLTKRLYLVRDAKRIADSREIPFGRIADPVGVGVERLFALFCRVPQSRRIDFLQAAGRAVWAEGLNVARTAGLHEVARRVGLDADTVKQALADESWRQVAEDNRTTLLGHGLWGVPCFVLGDFSTWGQDRIFELEARLEA